MHPLVVGTMKLIIISGLLAIIARMHDSRALGDPFFDFHKWNLYDAYRVLMVPLAFTYALFVIYHTLTLSDRGIFILQVAGASLYCVIIYICYIKIISGSLRINVEVFGLNKTKFLKSGVVHANIAGMFILLSFTDPKLWVLCKSGPVSHTASVSWYLFFLFLVVFIAPFLEELLFRGILYAPVSRRIGSWPGIATLSAVGVLAHLSYGVIPTAYGYVVQFLLYSVYRRSKSLYGPIIWHMALNFVNKRPEIALGLAPHLEYTTVYGVCIGTVFVGLTIINGFWLTEYIRNRKLERNSAR